MSWARRIGLGGSGVALALSLLVSAAWDAGAQDLEPRAYSNIPPGMNFVLAGYGYTTGDIVADPSFPLQDAQVHSNTMLVAYVRSLNIWGTTGKLDVILPYSWISGSATLAGRAHERDVNGLGDLRFRLSVNLYGAPALTLKEFENYKQDTIIGVSVQVSAPSGQYDPEKLLNIGSNRWWVKPEIGISKAWGPVTLELTPSATFFLKNNDFLGGKTLKEAPIYAVQGHVIYSFGYGIWASLDATYYGGGRTTIDGVEGDTTLSNVRLGATLTLPVSRRNSVKLYGSTGVYSRHGASYTLVGALWQFRWGAGL